MLRARLSVPQLPRYMLQLDDPQLLSTSVALILQLDHRAAGNPDESSFKCN